jgi:competence CoiA-like predicted nuclease
MRGKGSRNIVFMDYSDKRIIRNMMQDFYTYEKKVPTILKLLPTIKKEIYFPWVRLSLHMVVKNLRIMWRKFWSDRKILAGRVDTVAWKSRYLKEIKMCRDNKCSIFYTHEIWIDSK